jgi:hypothetical protein
MLPEAREAPEMKAHASPRDRVKIGCGCHHLQPSARAILKPLGAVFDGPRIAAVEEGRQIDLRARTTSQAPNGPPDPSQSSGST